MFPTILHGFERINCLNRMAMEVDLFNYLLNVLETLLNPLSANPTKSSNTLKQFFGCCRRIV